MNTPSGTLLVERYGPWALILGGSEGIGASFAEQLARAGFNITLAARTESRLEAAAANVRACHNVEVETRVLDLTEPGIADRAAEIVSEKEYGLIVYNAGATHGGGLFIDQPLQRALDLVALNCIGPIAFAHHALKPMRARGRGGLIILSSMSGLAGSGYVTTYAAVKSFEIALAEGLHWEMAREGVDVLCVVASLTDTPAMTRAGMRMDAVPDFVAMDPADVASGALASIGNQAVWYTLGEEVAITARTEPRNEVIDKMSRASGQFYGFDDG